MTEAKWVWGTALITALGLTTTLALKIKDSNSAQVEVEKKVERKAKKTKFEAIKPSFNLPQIAKISKTILEAQTIQQEPENLQSEVQEIEVPLYANEEIPEDTEKKEQEPKNNEIKKDRLIVQAKDETDPQKLVKADQVSTEDLLPEEAIEDDSELAEAEASTPKLVQIVHSYIQEEKQEIKKESPILTTFYTTPSLQSDNSEPTKTESQTTASVLNAPQKCRNVLQTAIFTPERTLELQNEDWDFSLDRVPAEDRDENSLAQIPFAIPVQLPSQKKSEILSAKLIFTLHATPEESQEASKVLCFPSLNICSGEYGTNSEIHPDWSTPVNQSFADTLKQAELNPFIQDIIVDLKDSLGKDRSIDHLFYQSQKNKSKSLQAEIPFILGEGLEISNPRLRVEYSIQECS